MQNLILDSQLANLFGNKPPETGYAQNPYAFLDLLRCAEPRYYHKERKAWFISGYHDVVRLLQDDRLFGAVSFADSSPQFRSTVVRKLRSLLSGVQISAMQPMLDSIVAAQIQIVLSKHRADLVADFSKIIPMAMMAELLGIPRSDWPVLTKLSDSFLDAFDLTLDGQRRTPYVMPAFLYQYFSRHYAAARLGSATPLMSMLLEEQHEHGLPDESMIDTCMKLVTAGMSTTASTLSNIMSRLLTKSDFSSFGEDSELRSAADELIRLETPILAIKRIARERVTAGGMTFEPGERIYLLIASANRDPEIFPFPHHINFHQRSNPALTFGPGRYHCIGSALARMEVVSMLKHVIPILKRIRIDKPIIWRSGWIVHEAQKIEVIINE